MSMEEIKISIQSHDHIIGLHVYLAQNMYIFCHKVHRLNRINPLFFQSVELIIFLLF